MNIGVIVLIAIVIYIGYRIYCANAWKRNDLSAAEKYVSEYCASYPKLIKIAKTAPLDEVRVAAIGHLSASNDNYPAIIEMLYTEPSEFVRLGAVKIIGEHRTTDNLLNLLKSEKDPGVRKAILQKLHDESAVREAASLAQDQEELTILAKIAFASGFRVERIDENTTICQNILAGLENYQLEKIARDKKAPENFRVEAAKLLIDAVRRIKKRVSWYDLENHPDSEMKSLKSSICSISGKIIIKAAEGMDLEEKKDIFELLQFVDGEIFKSPCDVGKHNLNCIKTYWTERSQTADSYGRSHEVKVYKCGKCGKEVEEMTGNWS